MLILLEDCYKKTIVKEDERGNMTIGALNFHDEELLLIGVSINLQCTEGHIKRINIF